MTRFVPCSSLEVAQTLSAHLWSLSRPPQVRGDEATAYLFDWRTDAQGVTWLAVVTDYAIPVHGDAVLDGIADILSGAGIGAQEITELEQTVLARRGQTLTPWQFFPQVFQHASKLQTEITWPSRT